MSGIIQATNLQVTNVKKLDGSAPELSDLGIKSPYEIHWWAYAGSQTPSADTNLLLTSFTTINNTNDFDAGSNQGVSSFTQVGTVDFSHSSGVFTFPRTGVWKITATLNLQDDDNHSRHVNSWLEISTNSGTSWSQYNPGYGNFNRPVSSNNYDTITGCRIVNVTNTSTFRFRWQVLSNTAIDRIRTSDDAGGTNVVFERVADAQS